MSASFFKLTVAYDGTAFSGWQRQPDQRTVQGVVEQAWHEITGESVSVTASGRTDAGVHAAGQVVGVESLSSLPASQLLRGLNAKLPDDVVVVAAESAPFGFHATSDARSKRYRYSIHNDRRPPLFERRYLWHVPKPLDAAAMHRAGQRLVGRHDFVSFETTGSPRESTVRTIFAVEVARGEGGFPNEELNRGCLDSCATRVVIDVTGDGFLYNMVRAIVGTLVRVGHGSQNEEWISEVLSARDRRAAGQTAPPHGLTLMEVTY